MFPKLFPEHVFEMFIGVLPKKKKKKVFCGQISLENATLYLHSS